MNVLPIILSFSFGTIIGSFLNVVSIRHKTGVGIGGRSRCMSCGKDLRWHELLPILSFFFQKGACKQCKSKISWQYPLVEFISGIIFTLIFIQYPPFSGLEAITTLIQIIIFSLLMVITVYDMKHKIIPDLFVFLFGLIALASLFVGGNTLWHIPSFWQIIAGPLLALPFALLWVVSRGKWMGLGDAKLVIGIGWVLGIAHGLNAIIIAFWIAAIVSIIWMLASFRRLKRGVEIPFGPYLILGMYIVLFFGVQVLDIDLMRSVILGL